MGHAVKLFVAHPQVLARFRAVVPSAQAFSLSAGATLAVLPLDEDWHDALHKANGTGDWPEGTWPDVGVSLTSTDIAFAARTSLVGPLAFIETDYVGGNGAQCAALWIGGEQIFASVWLDAKGAGNRPRATWPVNAALRGLGLKAASGLDEFDTFGLATYRDHDNIRARALPVRA